jgi:hypothetical protein
MKRFLMIYLIATLSLACNTMSFGQSANANISTEKSKPEAEHCTYKLFLSVNNTWCYDIYKNNKLFIHQTSIPGLPGNAGFKSKSDAEKVAQLAIEKIKKGESLPTITNEELRKLNVIN